MTEWLYEDGIGECRAALLDDGGNIMAIRVERDGAGPQAGSILPARFLSKTDRLARLESGEEVYLTRLPTLSEGAVCLLHITRAAIPERDLVKRAMGHVAEDGACPVDPPGLRARVEASGLPVRLVTPLTEDALEQAGWSEWLAAASQGILPFPGGILRMAPTPAMLVFDVDGAAPPLALALGGVSAMAAAIHRFALGGSLVIDLPTLPGKVERVAVADAFDTAMAAQGTRAFERTAINGYGLMQIIMPRSGPSLVELCSFKPVETAALALLRRAERAKGTGPITLVGHPGVIGWLEQRPHLGSLLMQRQGRGLHLHADPQRSMGDSDVH